VLFWFTIGLAVGPGAALFLPHGKLVLVKRQTDLLSPSYNYELRARERRGQKNSFLVKLKKKVSELVSRFLDYPARDF
jgi:hypothetical protein